MSRKEKTFIGCILAVISGVLSKGARLFLLLLIGVPFLLPILVINVAQNYMNAYDIPFEYMGKAGLDVDGKMEAEWGNIIYTDIQKKQWAFIIDSKEEYEESYEQYGFPDEFVGQFDFENNILIVSLNRNISAVRLLEKNTVWQDGIPYAFPEFTYKNQYENNMLYFYKVPRMDITYQNSDGENVSTKLYLWKSDYNDRKIRINGERQIQYVEWIPILKKWNWAFEKINVRIGEG